MNLFQGRQLLIATQHGKEQVIAPILEKQLNVQCSVTKDFDTDRYGTFSGEVERSLSAFDTLIFKSHQASEKYGADLVVASEGSFGQHPYLPFMPADDELISLLDTRHNLKIIARELSASTNFGQSSVLCWQELAVFADQHLFPSHSLILKNGPEKFSKVIKGINNWHILKSAYEELSDYTKTVWVATDMRANHNPSRMKVIEVATFKLAEKLASECPECQMPGFDVLEVIPGLPCAQCGSPTRTPIAKIFQCEHCSNSLEKPFLHNKEAEDPGFCDVCNP